jgi:hypothetical protein
MHEPIVMNGFGPEARDLPLDIWISWVIDDFQFFITDADGPFPRRNVIE